MPTTLNQVTPLDKETRSTLPTAEAARHLHRKAETLQHWSMNGSGPIKPLRVCGRLHWPVADIRRVLGVAA